MSMVARERELASVAGALERSRVVSVTGPAGIGKTTLARAIRRSWRGASTWVDLTAATGKDDLVAAVADAFGLSLADGGGDAVERVGLGLSTAGEALCVLDNFEKVVEHAGAIAVWVERAQTVRFLVTTQVRLRLAAEVVVELQPLDVAAATDLFVEAAQRVLVGYAPGAEELAQIRQLVDEVERVPLAVVLLAARRDVLGPGQLLSRLREHGLPSSPFRDTPSRHVNMAAALESSWALLPDAERRALARLSVFAGPFDLGLAEAAWGVSAEEAADLVFRLRDRSWLATAADSHGEVRLRLLTTIADMAGRKLDGLGLRKEAEAAHARAVLGRAERVPADFLDDSGLLAALLPLADDLRAVAVRALSPREAASSSAEARSEPAPVEPEALVAAFRAATLLDEVMTRTGPLSDHAALLGALGRAPGVDAVPRELRARVLLGRGRAMRFLGDPLAAATAIAEAARMSREAGSAVLASLAGGEAAYAALLAGDPAWAEALARQAIEDGAGEPTPTGIATGVLGITRLERGELREAHDLMRRSVELFRRAGARRPLGIALGYLGRVLHALGRFDEAMEACTRGLAEVQAVGDRSYEIVCTGLAAAVQHECGLLDRAEASYRTAAERAAALGVLHEWANAATGAAAVAADRGDLATATGLVEAVDGRPGTALPVWLARVLDIRRGHLALAAGRAAAAAGDREQARAHWLRAREVAYREHPSNAERIAARTLATLVERGAALGPSFALHREEGWVERPDGSRIDLARFGAMRRIFVRLFEERLINPGRPLSPEALLAAGWPGERMLATAGAQRLHTAVRSLRKAGLEDLLLTSGSAYLLDPAAPCTFVGPVPRDGDSPAEPG